MGFRNFLKKLLAQFISYLVLTLMGWVYWPLYIFAFLALFSAFWWPNIWPKMGFLELFEKKTIGSNHFIPGIYPYGVSLLTPIHFRVPSFIFGPLVAKYLAGNGVSGTFWKKIIFFLEEFPPVQHMTAKWKSHSCPCWFNSKQLGRVLHPHWQLLLSYVCLAYRYSIPEERHFTLNQNYWSLLLPM